MINLNLGIGGKGKTKEDGEKAVLVFTWPSVKHNNSTDPLMVSVLNWATENSKSLA